MGVFLLLIPMISSLVFFGPVMFICLLVCKSFAKSELEIKRAKSVVLYALIIFFVFYKIFISAQEPFIFLVSQIIGAFICYSLFAKLLKTSNSSEELANNTDTIKKEKPKEPQIKGNFEL